MSTRMPVARCMSKTSVEVDQDITREAAEILGTHTLIALLGQEGRSDFDATDHAWGSDQ